MSSGQPVGIDVTTGALVGGAAQLLPFFFFFFTCLCGCMCSGEAIFPGDEGIWDNYRVKKTLLHSWSVSVSMYREVSDSAAVSCAREKSKICRVFAADRKAQILPYME